MPADWSASGYSVSRSSPVHTMTTSPLISVPPARTTGESTDVTAQLKRKDTP
jgi:hypothetical protein